MKLLPLLLLTFVLSLGVACSSEPSFEEAYDSLVATREARIAAEATLSEGEVIGIAKSETRVPIPFFVWP